MKSLFRKLMFWRSSVPRVAMVRLAGVIASGGSPLRRGLNLDAVDPLLKKAFGLRRTKAVVLVINSPGGSPVQSAPRRLPRLLYYHKSCSPSRSLRNVNALRLDRA